MKIMINAIKDKLRKGSAYIFIAGATLGLPLATELSGVSKAFAQRSNELQRQELVYMQDKPEYASQRDDIQRNIAYIDKYQGLRNESARWGANAFALLFGLAGASCAVARKRKLDELLAPETQ